MSDLGFRLTHPADAEPVRVSLAETLSHIPAFRADARFGDGEGNGSIGPTPMEETSDLVEQAYARGFKQGHAQACSEAETVERRNDAARAALALSFARIDAGLEEDLRLRLRDTVAALCESVLAPMALDEDALIRRIERTVAMLARADDQRVVRLHPDDVALVSPRLNAEWKVVPDRFLERGAVRIENVHGGVEDGPANWRLAIAEALQQS